MLIKKDLSPRRLSAYTALALSVPVALGIYWLDGRAWVAGAALLLMLGGSYWLILSIFQRFIYRKIKLIYKFIHQTKAGKKQEMYNKYILPEKSIDEVRQDVEAWALQRSREIDILKRNEAFRKEFLQNLSHEFKTPVFAIQGYVDTLLQGAADDPDINRRFLQKASRNVERMVNLIQDLDEISRLERGELKLSPKAFIIQDVIREVFESLSLKAEQGGISLLIKKGCEAPLPVWADEEKIRQVLTNLADNAIKYGHRGGQVVASAYNVDDHNVLVEVSDNGMGISSDQLDRIFERFYRTQEGRGRDVTGSGLGLAICKHIVEAHRHTMHVRSQPSVGTTIGFTLNSRK